MTGPGGRRRLRTKRERFAPPVSWSWPFWRRMRGSGERPSPSHVSRSPILTKIYQNTPQQSYRTPMLPCPSCTRHVLGEGLVVGFLGIEPDRAVVANAELTRAKPLEPDDRRQVIDVRANMGSRLADPERRLDDGDDTGSGHGLVVVRRAGDHVRVWIDEHHQRRVLEFSNSHNDWASVDHVRRLFAMSVHSGARRFKRSSASADLLDVRASAAARRSLASPLSITRSRSFNASASA